MLIKLFLLGRPGCGKSSAAEYIKRYIANLHWTAKRFKDYDILYEMSKEEQYREKFKQTFFKEFQGFDVLDEKIFDVALHRLNTQIYEYASNSKTNEMILIEFARDDYIAALSKFASKVLQDSYFLCINVDINVCKERIRKRLENPKTLDDHYLSDEALQKFYTEQKFPHQHISKSFELDNNGTEQAFVNEIIKFVDTKLLKQ